MCASSARSPIRCWSASPAGAPEPGEAELVADFVITDPDGQVLVELHRVQFRPLTPPRPVLEELDRLWVEATFEPRSPRDEAGRADALAGERAFIVAAGEESTQWARDYAAQRGTDQVLTVRGGDPEQVCAEVEAELRALIGTLAAMNRPMKTTPARWWPP